MMFCRTALAGHPPGLRGDAAIARVYTLPFVPALLQTDAYTEAVYRDMERRPEDQIGELLDIRRGRQEALKRREELEPLKLVAVTHECTLRQTVGSPEIMRDQLNELLFRSDEEQCQPVRFPVLSQADVLHDMHVGLL